MKEFQKLTEYPSLYNHLEKKTAGEILTEINAEDHKVADAVHAAIPQITRLVEQLVPRMRKGGRLFYMGAGTSGRLGVLDASEIPPTYGMPQGRVIGLIAGGDTALRADTAEPAGANGDNAGTGAFGAEQHTRGTGAENTGLFCAEGYGRADRAGNADCPCGADTGGKRGKEGCL